jgi:hypothetical protein
LLPQNSGLVAPFRLDSPAASVANAAYINNTETEFASDFTSTEGYSSGELSNSLAAEKSGGYAIETTTAGAITIYYPESVTLTSDKGGINTDGAKSALYLGLDGAKNDEALTDSVEISVVNKANDSSLNLFGIRTATSAVNNIAADSVNVNVQSTDSAGNLSGTARGANAQTRSELNLETEALNITASGDGARAVENSDSTLNIDASSISLKADSATSWALGIATYFENGSTTISTDNDLSVQVTSASGTGYAVDAESNKKLTLQAKSTTLTAEGVQARGIFNSDGSVEIDTGSLEISASADSNFGIGIATYGTTNVTSSGDVKIAASSKSYDAYGLDTQNTDSSLSVEAKSISISSKTAEDASFWAYGVNGYNNGSTSLIADKIQVSASGNSARAIQTDYGASINIGDKSTSEIKVEAQGLATIAIFSLRPSSEINLTAKNIEITSKAAEGADLLKDIFGVHVQNNTQDETYEGTAATLSLTSEYTDGLIKVTSDGLGLSAFSNGIMNVKGNLEVEALHAIDTRGYATININTDDPSYTTKLKGDIVFETPNQENGPSNNSGNKIDAYVTISLNGSDSYWTGRSYQTYTSAGEKVVTSVIDPYNTYHGKVDGLTLSINDGATWNAEGETTGDSFVNVLKLNGGNINLQKGSTLYTAEFTVSGTNNTLSLGEGASVSGTIKLEAQSQLSAVLSTAYKDIDETNGVVNGAKANLSLEGEGSLRITDAFTYTATGLKSLIDAYTVSVIFDKAVLKIDPSEVSASVVIASNAVINLTAQGSSTDVASGAELKISGTVNVVKNEETSEQEAKLGTATVSENGTLNIQTSVAATSITAEKDATVSVTSSIKAEKVEAKDGAKILVGSNTDAGKFFADSLKLHGTMFLDPTWENGQESSEAAFNLDGKLEGQLVIGQNSKAEIGSSDTAELEAALKTLGKTVSQEGIKAIAYLNKAIELGEKGALVVDGELTEVPADSDISAGVKVASGSALVINAKADTTDTDGAIIKGNGGAFTVADVLYIDNAVADQELTVAAGFDSASVGEAAALNRLITLTKEDTADGLKLVSSTNNDLISSTIAPNTLNATIAGATGEGADRIAALFDATNGISDTAAAQSIDSIALMGTASAAQVVAINATNMIADSLEQHGSVLASYAHDKSGADLWIDLNGSFSKASGYKAGSSTYGYKSDLAGATIGADYAFGNGSAVGAAFSFGTGSARGQGNGSGIKNDIEYYGFNIYGAHNTQYANFIATLGYTLSKNEIKHQGYKGKPDVGTFTVGIRAEKDLKVADSFTITPHIGVRYMNVDMDDFTAGGFKYTAKKVNITQIPVGVAVNGTFKAPCEADVKPFADFTVAPALGNKKAGNKFGITGSAATDTISSRVANNALYQGRIGVNATKGNHSLSFSYGIGAGSDSRVDQALQAKYRYSF